MSFYGTFLTFFYRLLHETRWDVYVEEIMMEYSLLLCERHTCIHPIHLRLQTSFFAAAAVEQYKAPPHPYCASRPVSSCSIASGAWVRHEYLNMQEVFKQQHPTAWTVHEQIKHVLRPEIRSGDQKSWGVFVYDTPMHPCTDFAKKIKK